jgi:hypothetical protein
LVFDAFIPKVNSGIGVTMMADKIGFTKTYNPRLMYAYHMPLTEQSVLSFSVSGGVLVRHQDASGAIVNDLNDPRLYYGNITEYTPDFDFGLEYQGHFRLGAAVRHIGIQPSSNNLPTNSVNVWVYASTRFNRINKMSIAPLVSYMRRDGINRFEAGAVVYPSRSRHYAGITIGLGLVAYFALSINFRLWLVFTLPNSLALAIRLITEWAAWLRFQSMERMRSLFPISLNRYSRSLFPVRPLVSLKR